MDGGHALQNANSEKGSDGDGTARAGLQYDPRHEHNGHSGDDRRDEGVKGLIGLIRLQFCTYSLDLPSPASITQYGS